MWKVSVIVPMTNEKHSATFGDMVAIPATKDLSEKKTSVEALQNVVNGLCEDIDMIIHSPIMSEGRV